MLALVLLTGGLTGCIGGTDDGGNGASTVEPQNQSVGENETRNETAPAVEKTWTNETFEGTISGANVAGAATTQGSSFHTFTVKNGAAVLFLNVTAEGGEVEMLVGGPDCDISGQAIPACAQSVTTDGGEASYENRTAKPGEWQTRFRVAGPVGAQVSYTLNAVQGVVEPANA